MGEIRKQSVKGTIYTYIGAILGFVISGILFPKFLTTDQIGLISIIISYSIILAQVGSLGLISTTTRLFPYFRNDNSNHNGFLFLGTSITLLGMVISTILFFLISPSLIDATRPGGALLVEYSFLIYPLAFLTAFFNLYDHYNKVLYNASRGLLLRELILRIVIILLTFLLVYELLNFRQYLFLYTASYAVPLFLIVIMLLIEKQFSLKPVAGIIDRTMIPQFISVSLFGIITSATGIITINIDRIMVENYLGLSMNGIYTTCFFFGTLVILPSRAILRISSTYISEAFRNRDLLTIKSIYEKSSLNQFIIGCLILIGLLVNESNIFELLGDKFLPGNWVIRLIGLAFLIDMLAGASSTIIANSEYYKVQAVFMVIFILIVIITNMIFIPLMGITGAAFATVLAKLIYQFLNFIYLLLKLKLQPYNYRFLLVVLFSTGTVFLISLIDPFGHYILDILVRSVLTTLLFGLLILAFRISSEANGLANKFFNLLPIRKNKQD
jgi:O-antigen/teichoic acid export membrane protein